MPHVLRIIGTPPNTAQSPMAINTFERSRNIFATSSLAELLTPPSRIPTVTPSFAGCLRSVIGVDVRVTACTRVTMRSSMSSRDIWQPAQPHIQSLATVIFSAIRSSPPSASHLRGQGRQRGSVGGDTGVRRNQRDHRQLPAFDVHHVAIFLG